MKSSGSGFATLYPLRLSLFPFGYCRRLFQAVLVVSEHCNLLFNFVTVPFFAFLLPYVLTVLRFPILVWGKKLAKVIVHRYGYLFPFLNIRFALLFMLCCLWFRLFLKGTISFFPFMYLCTSMLGFILSLPHNQLRLA